MHELAIAESILNIARSEIEKTNASSIQELELEIGKLAGVEYSSLEFALQVITEGSIFKDTKIVIHKPKGEAECNECKKTFSLESFIGQCPNCNSYHFTITSGKELRVKSILID